MAVLPRRHSNWCSSMVSGRLQLTLILSFASDLCKQFGPRSDPTDVEPDLDPNCLTLLMFLKEF